MKSNDFMKLDDTTSIRYRELEPAPALSPYVLCYWEFKVEETRSGPYHHHIMPDGCVSLFYDRHIDRDDDGSGIMGPRMRELQVTVHPGYMCWGIRFWPGAPSSILHISSLQLRDYTGMASNYLPEFADTLFAKLQDSSSIETAAEVFDAALTEMAGRAADMDQVVRAGVEAIVLSQGQEQISDLAHRLGISERQFQRRFREAVGLTPKQFARIRRFRSSVAEALDAKLRNWGAIAAERGYSDQAHLNREFSQMVGLSPTSFQQRIRAIEHIDVTP